LSTGRPVTTMRSRDTVATSFDATTIISTSDEATETGTPINSHSRTTLPENNGISGSETSTDDLSNTVTEAGDTFDRSSETTTNNVNF
jgi:hypothetical protein